MLGGVRASLTQPAGYEFLSVRITFMYKCESCHERTVTYWRKLWATHSRPYQCSNCLAELYIPIAQGFKVHFYALAPAIIALYFVIKFQTSSPFLVLIPTYMWSIKRNILDAEMKIK